MAFFPFTRSMLALPCSCSCAESGRMRTTEVTGQNAGAPRSRGEEGRGEAGRPTPGETERISMLPAAHLFTALFSKIRTTVHMKKI
eukprot:scaffold22741_cov111-Isochrysis_galbana.AAC.4